MLTNYMGVFVRQDFTSTPVRDRSDKECEDCRNFMSGDGGPCNGCARVWLASNYSERPLWQSK